MVKCYTKKKKDGNNYTTCVEGQKKTKSKVRKISIKQKPKPKSKVKKSGITIKQKPKPKPKAKPKPKPKAKPKPKPKAKPVNRKLSAMEVVFGKGALGKKDSAVRKLVGSYRKGGKKGLMKNYVTVKQVKNWLKDKGNRRWFDDTFDETVFYPDEQSMNENDYGELKVKISSGRKSKRGGDKYWQTPYGAIDNLADQTGRDFDDLKDNIIDRQVYVAKKGSVAKAGRKYIKSLIEEAKNKKISYDFDETFQQFNMEDYIESELQEDEDKWSEPIEYKKDWYGM